MKNRYPTDSVPVKTDPNDLMCLNTVTLGMIKQIVDQNIIQTDLTIKPDGLRLTLIKKYPNKTVEKQSVDIDNGEYGMFQQKFMMALQKLNMHF